MLDETGTDLKNIKKAQFSQGNNILKRQFYKAVKTAQKNFK